MCLLFASHVDETFMKIGQKLCVIGNMHLRKKISNIKAIHIQDKCGHAASERGV